LNSRQILKAQLKSVICSLFAKSLITSLKSKTPVTAQQQNKIMLKISVKTLGAYSRTGYTDLKSLSERAFFLYLG